MSGQPGALLKSGAAAGLICLYALAARWVVTTEGASYREALRRERAAIKPEQGPAPSPSWWRPRSPRPPQLR